MTDANTGGAPRRRIELSPRTYRHLDRASKLLGVALVAVGLDAGGDTLVGISLGVLGAGLALTTVFLQIDS
ncbi:MULTISPECIES: hypothetical protein [Haloferax]|uniref:DUF8120 domain-containing protein n=5 Tax=Haloferax volcanii TaxID=2246 RepID=A0A384KH50_HALVD|nr:MULTISPECIES: hypothetical protein [Haloferax]ADE01622.1 uncharacterized protein HVO_B0163 [Haloferax volcanii DS2]ELK56210.1 hypothetical protein D320_00488 [Haloferax sp. BAB-2207]ELY36416.1 hypothetical protein C498_02825 [Haloferax volcanii DS2]ELZ77460.1 hypothetical protein C456_02946 [Haloferax lucentense DSM 14919]ELZ94753.1 hypothetical protein C452_01690 [Haloferax alexandrinus JCM 10717]